MSAGIDRPGGFGLPVPVSVAGTGRHLPVRTVTNQQLAQTLDTSDEWIVSRTGIRERRRLAPEQATSDMCVSAARPALASVGLTAADVDVIIIATYTYDQPLPSTALIVKEALGAHLLQSSVAEVVLIVAADCASRVTDPRERTTRVFFGDAAGAVVLSRVSTTGTGLLGWDFGSELNYGVQIPAGGSRVPASARTVAHGQHYVKMDGRTVWDTATRCLPNSILSAVERAGLSVGEITHFFLHQANLNIITATMDKLGVSMQRAPVTVDRLGNTGSAGVFTALHQSFSQGLVQPGDTYVLSAIGAGFQWGSVCFRHA